MKQTQTQTHSTSFTSGQTCVFVRITRALGVFAICTLILPIFFHTLQFKPKTKIKRKNTLFFWVVAVIVLWSVFFSLQIVNKNRKCLLISWNWRLKRAFIYFIRFKSTTNCPCNPLYLSVCVDLCLFKWIGLHKHQFNSIRCFMRVQLVGWKDLGFEMIECVWSKFNTHVFCAGY